MGSIVYEYLSFVANDMIFFSDDVQTTTIAVAIASSLCCSIVWAVFHIIGVARPSRTAIKARSNVISVYDEKHTGQNFYARKQPYMKQYNDKTPVLHDGEVDVPCVKIQFYLNLVHVVFHIVRDFPGKALSNWYERCGNFYADPSCRFVTCKNCCFSLAACNFHLQNKDIKCRTYLIGEDWPVQEIDLSECEIQKCPDRLGFVGAQLTLLNLSQNKLTFLPTEIGCLRGLKELYVDRNSISVIPDSLGSLENLETLDISSNQISNVPDALCYLPKLKVLKAGHNSIVALPECIGQIHCLLSLFIENNNLKCLNTQCTSLTSLVTLVLHNNPLTSLPDEIRNMIGLQVLDVSSCQIDQIPLGLCHCPKLKLLDLSHNRISWLPVEMGIMHCLQILHVNGNKLRCLPSTIDIEKLGAITVSDNPFHDSNCDTYTPVSLFPSLLEIALRYVCSHGNFHTDLLPKSLQDTLERKKICTGCGHSYFTFYKSSIRLRQTSEGSIPFYSQICSPHVKQCCHAQ